MNKAADLLEIVIIGGGPAGLSAAIWCADLGLKAILIEREPEVGGQLLKIFCPIENYPGVNAENGRELRDRIVEQVERSASDMRLCSDSVRIDTENKIAFLASGESFAWQNMIIATGVRRRKLGISGETEFVGRGILESGARDAAIAAGKSVAIIGGGDSALENARIVRKHAAQVYIVHRRDQFSARKEFNESAISATNVHTLMRCSVIAIIGNERVEAIEVEQLDTNERMILPVEIVLIRIGVEPNSDLVRGLVDLDDRGYIRVDRNCETSVRGVYAVGDIANPAAPTISSGVGQGATAAKAIAAQVYSKLGYRERY